MGVTQQVVVALAALGALAFIARRALAILRPPSSGQQGCDHCALASVVEDAAASASGKADAPAGRRR